MNVKRRQTFITALKPCFLAKLRGATCNCFIKATDCVFGCRSWFKCLFSCCPKCPAWVFHAGKPIKMRLVPCLNVLPQFCFLTLGTGCVVLLLFRSVTLPKVNWRVALAQCSQLSGAFRRWTWREWICWFSLLHWNYCTPTSRCSFLPVINQYFVSFWFSVSNLCATGISPDKLMG